MRDKLAYALMSTALAAGVVMRGGVDPRSWGWCALATALAAGLWLMPSARAPLGLKPDRELILLCVVTAWMLLQLAPLPMPLIAWLSPLRASAIAVARALTGREPNAWASISLSPALTIERLLDVLPAMAMFIAAREMAWQWSRRMWLAVAPIVVVAALECGVGFVQFWATRQTGGPINGSYANRDHFSALLEMALPIAVMAAIATWKSGEQARMEDGARLAEKAGPAFRASAGLAIAVCLLVGVILSQSRTGLLSAAAGVGIAIFLTLRLARMPRMIRSKKHRAAMPGSKNFRGAIPAAAVLALLGTMLVWLPTRPLRHRLGELTAPSPLLRNVRFEIWRDTVPLLQAYKWTGCGLGAYERGLYLSKRAAPTNTVDYAHNDYLQVLAELGLPGGGMAWILAGGLLWKSFRRAVENRGRERELAAGLVGALVAFGVHSLADFNLYIPANALAAAWLAGLSSRPGIDSAVTADE